MAGPDPVGIGGLQSIVIIILLCAMVLAGRRPADQSGGRFGRRDPLLIDHAVRVESGSTSSEK